MCDKAILKNAGKSKSVSDCYKFNKCIIKLLIIILIHKNLSLIAIWLEKCVIKLSILHPCTIQDFTIQVVPECYKADETSVKAVNRCFFVFDSILDLYKNEEMCDRAVSEDHLLFNILLSWLI